MLCWPRARRPSRRESHAEVVRSHHPGRGRACRLRRRRQREAVAGRRGRRREDAHHHGRPDHERSTGAKIGYKQQGQAFPKQGTTNYQAVRDSVLTLLVEQAELNEKAASMGITVTNADITARLDSIEKQYFGGSEKKYLAAAKKQGYDTDAQVRSDVIKPQLISERVQKQIMKDVKVSERRSRHLLQGATRRSTQQAESRDLRYILVGKSKATAQSVYQQLANGTDKTWCTLAKRYAKDSSGQNCGKATFSKGQTVADLRYDSVHRARRQGGEAVLRPDAVQGLVRDRAARPREAQVDDSREASRRADPADAARTEAEDGDLRLVVEPEEELLQRLEDPVPGRLQAGAGSMHGDDDQRDDDAISCRSRTRSSSCRR